MQDEPLGGVWTEMCVGVVSAKSYWSDFKHSKSLTKFPDVKIGLKSQQD